MEQSTYSIGVFARRAGVSVRTLQYYDRIGLLNPSAHSEGGRRRYAEADFARLQQIVTLKYIGLSLDDIRALLADEAPLDEALRRQMRALEAKARQTQQIMRAITAAQSASNPADLDHIVTIIREVQMSHQTDWLGQFFSEEQQETLADATQGQSLAEQKQTGRVWQALFADIQAYLAGPPDDDVSRSLAGRWHDLLEAAAPGDAALQARIGAAYAHMGSLADGADLPDAVRAWLHGVQDAANFAGRA